jgi:hypothetical protein
MKQNKRREFLQQFFNIALRVSAGGYWLAACSSQKKAATKTTESRSTAGPCDDLSGVDPVDVEKRKALGYTNLSPIPDKPCNTCKLWIPEKEGQECGGCMLFAGPVSPEGHCTYWAPQV